MCMILLAALSAASEEDYAVVISGEDSYSEYCQDCYANIITQADNQIIEEVNIGVSNQIFDVGVGDEGLTAASTFSRGNFARLDTSGNYVIEGLALNGLPGNGIMIADVQAPIILKNVTVDSQGVQGQSSEPVGIGMVNARNVIIEDCTALSGSLFRLSRSDNIQIKNDTAKNIFLEGILNSIVDNCTADCIMIKGAISLFYSDKPKRLANATIDDSNLMPENIIEISKNCTIKNCNRVAEIDLFNAEDCTVESCTMEGVGLWMVNARNTTVSNASVVNGTLSIDWSRDLVFRNLTLIDSDISMAGSVPEDFSMVFKDCQVDGMPILYYENQEKLELENLTAGQIWLRQCPGAHIDGCAAGEIYVIDSDGAVIENSKIDGEGINLIFSEDCVLSNNILSKEIKSQADQK